MPYLKNDQMDFLEISITTTLENSVDEFNSRFYLLKIDHKKVYRM